MKPKNFEQVGLESIADGAVVRLFNEELAKVLANIEDIHTEQNKARTITLSISLKPDRERETAQVEISTKCSLAPIMGTKLKVAIERDKRGKLGIFESLAVEVPDNVSKLGY